MHLVSPSTGGACWQEQILRNCFLVQRFTMALNTRVQNRAGWRTEVPFHDRFWDFKIWLHYKSEWKLKILKFDVKENSKHFCFTWKAFILILPLFSILYYNLLKISKWKVVPKWKICTFCSKISKWDSDGVRTFGCFWFFFRTNFLANQPSFENHFNRTTYLSEYGSIKFSLISCSSNRTDDLQCVLLYKSAFLTPPWHMP